MYIRISFYLDDLPNCPKYIEGQYYKWKLDVEDFGRTDCLDFVKAEFPQFKSVEFESLDYGHVVYYCKF